MSDDYNRAHFPRDLDDAAFAGFKSALEAGERAPDGTLVDAADGAAVKLSKLWRDPLVVEFGSHT